MTVHVVHVHSELINSNFFLVIDIFLLNVLKIFNLA